MPMDPDETTVHPVPDAAVPDAAVPDAAVPDAAVPDAAVAALTHAWAGPRLRQIADVLGCSVDDFFDAGALPPDLAGATELLRLWSVVTDEPGRARLLARVRDASSAS